MIYLKVPLPGGSLKLKSYQILRSVEREHRIPTLKIGNLYLSWWSSKNERRYKGVSSSIPPE